MLCASSVNRNLAAGGKPKCGSSTFAGTRYTLIVDEIRMDDDSAVSAPLPAPENLRAIGYDRHVEVRWNRDVAKRD
jgi:hypothetical protein